MWVKTHLCFVHLHKVVYKLPLNSYSATTKPSQHKLEMKMTCSSKPFWEAQTTSWAQCFPDWAPFWKVSCWYLYFNTGTNKPQTAKINTRATFLHLWCFESKINTSSSGFSSDILPLHPSTYNMMEKKEEKSELMRNWNLHNLCLLLGEPSVIDMQLLMCSFNDSAVAHLPRNCKCTVGAYF